MAGRKLTPAAAVQDGAARSNGAAILMGRLVLQALPRAFSWLALAATGISRAQTRFSTQPFGLLQRIEAHATGLEPHGIDPGAVAATAEVGIDIPAHGSKDIAERGQIDFDYVITVCGRGP